MYPRESTSACLLHHPSQPPTCTLRWVNKALREAELECPGNRQFLLGYQSTKAIMNVFITLHRCYRSEFLIGLLPAQANQSFQGLSPSMGSISHYILEIQILTAFRKSGWLATSAPPPLTSIKPSTSHHSMTDLKRSPIPLLQCYAIATRRW
jgi:hypothetical protein